MSFYETVKTHLTRKRWQPHTFIYEIEKLERNKEVAKTTSFSLLCQATTFCLFKIQKETDILHMILDLPCQQPQQLRVSQSAETFNKLVNFSSLPHLETFRESKRKSLYPH